MEGPAFEPEKIYEKIIKKFQKIYVAVYTINEFLIDIVKLRNFSVKQYEVFFMKTLITTNFQIDYQSIDFMFNKKWNTETILKMAIKKMLNIDNENVLKASQFKENVQGKFLSRYMEHSFQRNYNFLIFHSPEWQLVHSLIGDEWMSHLLEKYSIFELLPNQCYLQVTGAPISECLKLSQQTSAERQKRKLPFTKLKKKKKTKSLKANF